MKHLQHNIYLLGAPGAGKGTQARALSSLLHIPQISTGDMLREVRKKEGELGKKLDSIMNRGDLVPDELVSQLAVSRLKREDCRSGFILDGFPRTKTQAETLDVFLEKHQFSPLLVIIIEVSVLELQRRLLGRIICPTCGRVYHRINNPPTNSEQCDDCSSKLVVRADDHPDVIQQRIKNYFSHTEHLIEHYSKKQSIFRVDGTGTEDKVFQQILSFLSS